MKAASSWTLALGCFLLAPWAYAQEGDAGQGDAQEGDAQEGGEKKDAAAEEDDDFGHSGQFALRASLVAGYRMILRYDESPPYCREYDFSKGDEQQKFCGHAAPLAVDLGLSFAPLDFIEPYVWLRLGLGKEEETNTEPVVILGAGARIYTMSDSAFKIYIEPAVGLELEEITYNDEAFGTDFIFHLAAGPQFDLAKNFGLFVDGGLTVGILRYLHSSLELKAGVQGRFP